MGRTYWEGLGCSSGCRQYQAMLNITGFVQSKLTGGQFGVSCSDFQTCSLCGVSVVCCHTCLKDYVSVNMCLGMMSERKSITSSVLAQVGVNIEICNKNYTRSFETCNLVLFKTSCDVSGLPQLLQQKYFMINNK